MVLGQRPGGAVPVLALAEQSVETGMRDAATDTIEIRSGLPPGARVVVGNLANLRAGQPVRVMNVPTE